MELNIYNSLILAGIIQGFIFAGVVFITKKYKSQTLYFLAALIFVYSYSNLQYFIPDSGLLSEVQMYIYIFIPIAPLTPVLIYFYVMTFLYPMRKTLLKEKLLYLPFLVFLILSFIYRIGALLDYQNESFYTFFASALNAQEIIAVIMTIIILSNLLLRIRRYEAENELFVLDRIPPRLKWLKLTLFLTIVLTVLWAFLVYQNIFVTETFTSFYLLWIGLSALIYWLGHIGIYKYGVNEERKKIRKQLKQNENFSIKERSKNEHVIALERLLIDDKIYLEPSLTLDYIANKLELSTSYLSRILNAELGMGFTDYLNSFRVQQAKEYLKNPEFSRYTIVAIGLEAGFNSKSAFFKVFKKNTGLTPLEYKKENLHLPAV